MRYLLENIKTSLQTILFNLKINKKNQSLQNYIIEDYQENNNDLDLENFIMLDSNNNTDHNLAHADAVVSGSCQNPPDISPKPELGNFNSRVSLSKNISHNISFYKQNTAIDPTLELTLCINKSLEIISYLMSSNINNRGLSRDDKNEGEKLLDTLEKINNIIKCDSFCNEWDVVQMEAGIMNFRNYLNHQKELHLNYRRV